MELDQRYIEDCFIKYAKVNTRSDVSSKQVPTTPGQKKLAPIVCDDLKKLGLRHGITKRQPLRLQEFRQIQRKI